MSVTDSDTEVSSEGGYSIHNQEGEEKRTHLAGTLHSNMSVTDSDTEVSSDGAWTIYNQQGDPRIFPPSQEYWRSSGIEVTETTTEIDALARWTDWMEHSGHKSNETDAGTVTTRDQGTQTDAGTVTTRDRGTQTDAGTVTTRDQGTQTDRDMFQPQSSTDTGDSVMVMVMVKKVSDGKNKRKFVVYDEYRPAKKERKRT